MKLSLAGEEVDLAINNIDKTYKDIRVDKYVIMPNHIHLIIINDSKNNNISKIIQQFKGIVSKRCGKNLWQKSYFDHIIRQENEYIEILRYIENNVQKWELDKYFN